MSKPKQAFAALRRDLIDDNGPRISTMRNYRFAIVQYKPHEEYAVRAETQRLSSELCASGWSVIPIDLHRLLMERVRAQGDDWMTRVVDMERRLAQTDPRRGLNYLIQKLTPLVEGPDGIAADCSRIITEHAEAHPERVERTLALIGRTGALYPFFRSSALLRHLDGRTKNVPVVLLYPGERPAATGLSFMGELAPDHDYRPRIYP
ncbi:DUF1788 domain-containing protein [Haliangium ochraceum]|uniref:DUF1788 domain-containing protein n=1 Tax=Haliangium ochraceum (strain DSM 14365 / JCM 11303 / SMP-2) TaxID=502025 RepID=D0LLL9_HALO1|nr:DUF1788 domain-containing protein [Haliangium ochraceum]ACY13236.1 conserved hypothetical protein [Haliangium ochraceum DSM 14365]ACY13795.1 conserved hypothetical protein [Haliangium ochraceum DSM 14365]